MELMPWCRKQAIRILRVLLNFLQPLTIQRMIHSKFYIFQIIICPLFMIVAPLHSQHCPGFGYNVSWNCSHSMNVKYKEFSQHCSFETAFSDGKWLLLPILCCLAVIPFNIRRSLSVNLKYLWVATYYNNNLQPKSVYNV